MNRNWRQFLLSALIGTAGLLVSAVWAPAMAQDIVPHANRSVPEDWSHRHVVNRSAETMKEAAGKGRVEFDKWHRKMKDPRFVMAVARKTIDEQPTVNKVFSGQQLAHARRWNRNTPASTLTRDWSVPLGSATAALTGTGVGTPGMFPAKFTWDINAAPSCANDFIVYTTMTPGATTGTSAKQTVSFVAFDGTSWGNVSAGNGTITLALGASSITLKGSTTASPTSNTGLNFYMGAAQASNSPAYYAYNLAAAINRNGHAVGVSATSAGGVVTIIANAAGTGGNSITIRKSAAFTNLTLGGGGGNGPNNLSGGAASGVQPTLVAYNNLYKTTCNQSPVGLPSILWSVNTGTGTVAETSPALSLDGSQVAFVQRTSTVAGPSASLVLLKWSNSGTATVVPTTVTAGNYRACTAPCMTVFSLGANNQNSSPYVDYDNDVIYVGDAAGKLHKFTDVFNGTPAEVVSSPWPVTVSAGNMLSSPVYESASNRVFVGSDVSEVVAAAGTPYTGGMLHAINAATSGAGAGAVVNSAQIGGQTAAAATSRSKMPGVRDGAIVDSMAQRVYAFTESDTTTTCGNATSCKAVYQFATNFAETEAGTARQVGRGQIAGRVMYIGQFDDAYWSSDPTSPTGNLYTCGSGDDGTNSRAPTLWKIPITNNVFGVSVPVIPLTTVPATGEVGASCSPITTIKNGANEYLYVAVTANGNTTGCAGACVYMVQLANIVFDATAAASAFNTNAARYFNIVGTQGLNGNELNRDTQISAAQAGTYKGMTITQGAATPAGNVNTYMLRKNAANTTITCTIPAGQTQCTDTYNTVILAQNDLVSVRVLRTSGSASLTTTMRVQLSKATAAASTSVVTGLPATGGTSGIVVDNISTAAGASQVYYSTLARPGNAIQASQAGLQ